MEEHLINSYSKIRDKYEHTSPNFSYTSLGEIPLNGGVPIICRTAFISSSFIRVIVLEILPALTAFSFLNLLKKLRTVEVETFPAFAMSFTVSPRS